MMKLLLVLLFSYSAFAEFPCPLPNEPEGDSCLEGKTTPILTNDDIDCLKKEIIDSYRVEYCKVVGQTFEEGEAPYEPKAMFDEYYILMQDLLVDGYAPLAAFKSFAEEYESLLPENLSINDPQFEVTVTDENGNESTQAPDPKVFWEARYLEMFSRFISNIQNSSPPPSLAGVQEYNATARMCVQGLEKNTYFGAMEGKKSGADCKKIQNGKDIADHEACASKVCLTSIEAEFEGEENPTQVGAATLVRKCAAVKRCFEKLVPGQSCDPIESPLCVGSYCMFTNANVTGLNECRAENEACSGPNAIGDAECCTGKCSAANKCIQAAKCMNCVKSGKIPGEGQECCPGYYKSSEGKCRTNLLPLVPIIQSSFQSKMKSTLKFIFDQIFPSAYGNETEEELTASQQEYIENQRSECQANFAGNAAGLQNCLAEIESTTANNFAGVNQSYLTQEQRLELDRMRIECSKLTTGTQSHEDCMQSVAAQEKAFIADNKAANITGEKPTAEQLIAEQKGPLVTGKTYSNPKKCEFYSFNDNWRDASIMEQNAEVFLRGFEFTFSHQGTQDYWVDSEANSDNIFSRANAVAKKFRKNRGEMILKMREIDRKMSCKCIAIFGPQNFDAEKQSFFNQSCEDEKALLATNLQTDVGKDINSDGEGQTVQGAKLENITDAEDTSEKKIEEMDKGAIGISHERLLIEWMGLRRDAQIARFVDNSELEADLAALSDFIGETDFEEVWIDKIEGNALVAAQPRGDTVPLYNWGYKYPKKWFAILIIILAIGLGAAIGAFAITSLGLLGGAGIGLAAGAMVAGLVGAFKGPGAPGIGDVRYVKKKRWSTFKRWDGYTKYFIGPKFDNNSTKSDTRCQIFGNASACLKSAYALPLEDMEYLDHLNGVTHYLVDPKLPLFVEADKVSLETMPGYNKTWVQVINDIRDTTVNFALNTAPGGKKYHSSAPGFNSPNGEENSCHRSGSKGCYNITGKSFGKRDIFQEAINEGTLAPMGGSFSPVTFGSELRGVIKNAAKKYALCKSFKGGGEESESSEGTVGLNNSLTSGCGLAEMNEYDMGFGELYETETAAEDFAKYALEMHYIYSSLSLSTEMGYPLMGQEAYFAMVAYNMKLVGSLAAGRANKYAEVYDLYVADWEKRIGEYNSLGEGVNAGKSVNIEYSQKFYDLFGRFSFNGTDNIESFDAALNTAQSDGSSFNSAELRALSAGRNKAVRTNSDLKKQNEFLADTKNLPGQELRIQKQANQIANNISPIKRLNAAEMGGFGVKKLNKALGQMNKNMASLAKRRRSSRNSRSNPSPFVMPKFGGLPKMPRPSTSTGNGFNNAIQKDQGMSTEQANALINRLKRDKSLSEQSEADTIFTVVSKAYKRNYDKVLVRNRKKSSGMDINSGANMDNKLEDKKKQELKKLLSQ